MRKYLKQTRFKIVCIINIVSDDDLMHTGERTFAIKTRLVPKTVSSQLLIKTLKANLRVLRKNKIFNRITPIFFDK